MGKKKGKTSGVAKNEWQTLLGACHQCWANPLFTEDNFPLEPIAADEDDWEVVEHHIQDKCALEQGLKKLKKLAAKDEIRLLTGSRLAMKYIAQHPNFQLDHPIILPIPVFQARWGRQTISGVPSFIGNWSGGHPFRRIYVPSLSCDSSPDCGWLVLKRKQK